MIIVARSTLVEGAVRDWSWLAQLDVERGEPAEGVRDGVACKSVVDAEAGAFALAHYQHSSVWAVGALCGRSFRIGLGVGRDAALLALEQRPERVSDASCGPFDRRARFGSRCAGSVRNAVTVDVDRAKRFGR